MGLASSSSTAEAGLPPSAIALSYQVVLGTGAQSVTADRDTRRSDCSDENEAVRQQGITERQ